MSAPKETPNIPFVDVGLIGMSQAVALAAGVALQVVTARHLEPPEYASFASANLIGLLCVVALVGGLPMALRREVSVRADSQAQAFSVIIRVQFPLCVGAAGLLLLLRSPLAALLSAPELHSILPVVAADVALRAGLLDPCLLLLNGAGDRITQLRLVAGFHACRVAFAVVLLVGLGFGLIGAMVALLLATTTGAGVAVVCLTMRVGLGGRGMVPLQRGRSWGLRWLGYSSGYEVAGFTLLAMNLWAVKALWPDHPELGSYAVVSTMSRFALPFGQALGSGSFRWVARAQAGGDARLRPFVRGCALALAGVSACGTLVGAGCGPVLVDVVFGHGYHPPALLCGLLFGGAGLAAMAVWLGELLGAVGRVEARFWAATASLMLCGVITLGLTREFGLNGAAWSLVIGNVLATLMLASLLSAAVKE